jgi:Dna[CI] antecedent, DciA
MPQKPPSFKVSLSFQNRTMAFFYSQIEQQQRILQRIQAVLPEALAKQVRHCLIKDKKLLIYTDSAAWASQLRFYKSAILASTLPLTRSPVEMLQIKIISGQAGLILESKRKAKIPSAEKIEVIRNHGLTVSDNQLRLALLRLSTTLERLSSKT